MTNNRSKRIVFMQDGKGRAIGYTTLGKYSELKNAIGGGGSGNPILISQPSYVKPTTRSSKPCCGKRRK